MLPAISCGVYGYPIEKAAAIAVATVVAECASTPGIARVLFVLHSGSDLAVHLTAFAAA